jgi:transposase
MLSLPAQVRIFVARDPVDFRKAFDGLCQIVRDVLKCDPFTGDMFAFFNKRRDRVKLLYWDRNGFWLLYKRLERGTFEAWRSVDVHGDHIAIDRGRLMMLLEGIELKRARDRRGFSRSVEVGRRSTRGT